MSSNLNFLEFYFLEGEFFFVFLKLFIRVMLLFIIKEIIGNLVVRKLLNCFYEDYYGRFGLNRIDVRKMK